MRLRDGGQLGETGPLGQKDNKTLEICRGRGASEWLKTNFVPVFLKMFEVKRRKSNPA